MWPNTVAAVVISAGRRRVIDASLIAAIFGGTNHAFVATPAVSP
jgi:hypothetical protein